MTLDEYNTLFHKEQLNLVAFKMLFQCDKEVLRLVNAAIEQEREACAKLCDEEAAGYQQMMAGCSDARYDWKVDGCMDCAAAIRARGEKNAP